MRRREKWGPEVDAELVAVVGEENMWVFTCRDGGWTWTPEQLAGQLAAAAVVPGSVRCAGWAVVRLDGTLWCTHECGGELVHHDRRRVGACQSGDRFYGPRCRCTECRAAGGRLRGRRGR